MPSPSQVLRGAIAASPRLRAAVKSRPAQHVIQTQRAARIVQPTVAFTARQAGHATARYALRSTGAGVSLRHRTRDVAILNEIFGHGDYRPPAGVDLAGPVTVLDLGGNVGLFGLYALHEWTVTRLRSFEPDPANYALLEANAAPFAAWETVQAAVGPRAGAMRFVCGGHSDSREARPGEDGVLVPMVDVFAEAPVDLLKVDIEGGEWPILADPRLRGVARVVVLEWHAATCPAPDAHALAGDLLRAAGYTRQYSAPREHDGNGVLWAWR